MIRHDLLMHICTKSQNFVSFHITFFSNMENKWKIDIAIFIKCIYYELRENYLLEKKKKKSLNRFLFYNVNIHFHKSIMGRAQRHFFFDANRFGADTLTFPGMFLDRSVSCKTAALATHTFSSDQIHETSNTFTLLKRSFSRALASFPRMKLSTAVRAAAVTDHA